MTRPSFRQIGAPLDVDDAALERLNERMGVPELVKSPVSGQGPTQDKPKPAARPSPSPKPEDSPRPKKSAASAEALRPTERINIELPGYLTDALKRQAVDNRTTARHIVMLGLLAIGFKIDPADLVPDARRTSAKAQKG